VKRAAKYLASATENYERHGQANSPARVTISGSEEEFAAALEKTSQIHVEQLALGIGVRAPIRTLLRAPVARFHGDVVACMGDVEIAASRAAGTFFSHRRQATGENRAALPTSAAEYEVPYVSSASPKTRPRDSLPKARRKSAAMLLIRAAVLEKAVDVSRKRKLETVYGHADLFDVTPTVERPSPQKFGPRGFFSDFCRN